MNQGQHNFASLQGQATTGSTAPTVPRTPSFCRPRMRGTWCMRGHQYHVKIAFLALFEIVCHYFALLSMQVEINGCSAGKIRAQNTELMVPGFCLMLRLQSPEILSPAAKAPRAWSCEVRPSRHLVGPSVLTNILVSHYLYSYVFLYLKDIST